MTQAALLGTLLVLLLGACSAPAAQDRPPQRSSSSQGSSSQAAGDAERQRDAALQDHLANARDYRANDQHGLALQEVSQALALQPNHSEAQELQRQIRPEATAQVQQIQQARAQATAAAEQARANATAEARAAATSQAQARIDATAAARAAAPAPAAPAARTCCRICRTGKACGDSCIAANLNCRVGAGCACNAYVPGTPQPFAWVQDEIQGLIAAIPSYGTNRAECEYDDGELLAVLL